MIVQRDNRTSGTRVSKMLDVHSCSDFVRNRPCVFSSSIKPTSGSSGHGAGLAATIISAGLHLSRTGEESDSAVAQSTCSHETVLGPGHRFLSFFFVIYRRMGISDRGRARWNNGRVVNDSVFVPGGSPLSLPSVSQLRIVYGARNGE